MARYKIERHCGRNWRKPGWVVVNERGTELATYRRLWTAERAAARLREMDRMEEERRHGQR